jgi:regulator of replication initiation timing
LSKKICSQVFPVQAREKSEEAERLRKQMGKLEESNTQLQTELQKREKLLQKAREEEEEAQRYFTFLHLLLSLPIVLRR